MLRTPAAVPLAACLIAAFSFGLAFAARDGNQVTYLLEGLRRVDPDLLRADWLAAETFAYHPSFAWIVVGAAALGSVPWSLALLNLAVITASLWLLYRLLREFAPDVALPALAVLLALVVLGGTESVGMTYIFSRELQPSGFASFALIGAITAFLRGRWAVSGIALASSGALHSNFLLVGLTAFGLAHLLATGMSVRTDGRNAFVAGMRAAGIQLGPALLVLAVQLPMLLAMAADPDGETARRIFLEIRSPHHYLPRTYLVTFLPFIAWHLLAWVVPFPFGRTVRSRWLALHASLVVIVLAATLLTTVVFVPVVSQLFFWRLAPFAVLLAQLTTVAGAAAWLARRHAGGVPAASKWSRTRLAAAVLAAVLFLRRAIWTTGAASPTTLGIAAAAVAIAVIVWRANRTPVVASLPPLRALALIVFLVAAGVGVRMGLGRSNLLASDITPAEQALFGWAGRTHADARFLVPPEMASFRLRAARAIVVDWKSTPILPAQLIEWYRRIDAVSGGVQPGTVDEAAAGYRALDARQLAGLVAAFDVDYAVVPREATLATARSGRLPIVWENEQFLVLDARALLVAPDSAEGAEL